MGHANHGSSESRKQSELLKMVHEGRSASAILRTAKQSWSIAFVATTLRTAKLLTVIALAAMQFGVVASVGVQR
jgi:hypothetical protein